MPALTLPRKSKKDWTRGGVTMPQPELTIEQMEAILGYDKVKPITATPSDSRQLDENAEFFRKWYEEELRELIKRSGRDVSGC
ncbi:MAG: hypothetical protein ACYC2T_05005 [Bacillota bacterium]